MANDILAAISAIGRVKQDKMKAIYDTLMRIHMGDGEEYIQPLSDILSWLETLGHCEIDYRLRQILVCPPSFLLLPHPGLPKFVLVGGRDKKLLDRLQRISAARPDLFRVTFEPHPENDNPLFPPAVYVLSTNKNYVLQLAEKLGIECSIDAPAAWKLLLFSPSLRDIKDSLLYFQATEPNWKHSSFCHERLRFSQDTSTSPTKLVAYTNPINQQQKILIWNNDTAAEVDKNWGRYLVLGRHKCHILLYDERKQKMAVPITVPLPKYLARAIALCSGVAPRKKELHQQIGVLKKGITLLIYEKVPQGMAHQLGRKLGQTLQEANL
ncbi:hypothetical protein ACFQI7_32540 [Paenibacillus allorhizosphaerae]|uniref:Uncharacterized protein n=1 Tax=Paenibacillus allorhizosphaerae TaxID=2849866 RepID=A0ABN7TWC7_9BACL|nr:hypothetical protein [Paenibacillus allorhizosphaerae]CAG7658401.1 hypothetical protein PAECIP111802_07034 [Paenibacillus allorhizosphaerae]